MATGTFGTRRPADVSINDVEIFYTYSQNRETTNTDVFTLDATEILTELNDPNDTDNPLGGLYNLRLPSTVFNAVGIYTVYIRPKQIQATVVDCSTLSSNSSIKGIVLDSQETTLQEISDKLNNNGLIGFRVEYYNNDGTKRRGYYKIITSNNRAEAITQNNNGNSSTVYRFNDSSTLIFVTVSPSSSTQVKANSIPYIGSPGDSIILMPTTFNPIMIEVELSNYTTESIGTYLEGQMIRDIPNGITTVYDESGNIIKQYDLYSVHDEFGNEEFQVKQVRTSIDESQNFDDIISQ